MIEPDLSAKGTEAAKSTPRIDLKTYFEALENLYSEDNPNGALPLNMAENKQCWPELSKKFQTILQGQPIPDWVAGYTSTLGHPPVRAAVANFLARHLTGCPIDPAHLALSAGASGVIEVTSLVLGNPGDMAVFPAPSYPVYKLDISGMANLERFDLVTHFELEEISRGPKVTIDVLEKAKQHIESKGKRFRMLVLTHPDNPTGLIYSELQLRKIAHWCMQQKIHCVVNEIYGLSMIETTHPDIAHQFADQMTYYSFGQLIDEFKSPYLHLWYAFSKDFGVSGFRIGLLLTQNTEMLKAYANLNLGHMVSNLVQFVWGEALSDEEFISHYLQLSKERLTRTYLTVVKMAEKLKIPFVPARGSLFVWIDLSEFLKEQTQDAENALWMDLYKATGILLTPGSGFGHVKRGQFRIVHSYLPYEALNVAMHKLSTFVRARRLNT